MKEASTLDSAMQHTEEEAGDVTWLLWPIVAAALSLVAAATLIWWARADDRGTPGIMVGVVLGFAVTALLGWGIASSRARRRAEADSTRQAGAPRSDLVIAFSIPEGQLEAARDGGLLDDLEAIEPDPAKGLRDVRLMFAPAETGPVQALVETVWGERATREAIEALRDEILNILDERSDNVVPGSIQVMDMAVLRDTPRRTTRMTFLRASGIVGGLAVLGFALGGFLTLFQPEEAVIDNNDVPAPPPPVVEFTGTILEERILFFPEEFSVPPNTEVTLVEDNQDEGVPHNIRIFAGSEFEGPTLTGCISGCIDDGDEIVTPVRFGITTNEFTFMTPDEGEYAFLCDIHPVAMRGIMTVEEGAPVPTDRVNGDGE